ncbi:MAG: TIGR04211 family SH3 domain-containing protein [Desulfobacteraceae bacterium]|nr:TIGR04211 family SH3 domain-containing protein [Desulfobacteraceae bacterium]
MECLRKFSVIIPLALGLCLIGEASWATKAYVTDSLKISIRTGPSIENKIINYLGSGQPVDVLESQEGWSHVRVLEHKLGDLEGWILSRYLITRLPWEFKVKSLKEENTKIKEKLAHIEKEYGETASREQVLTKEKKEDTEALEKLLNEYETLRREPADYLKLKDAHERTRSALESNQENIKELTQENETLRTSQRNRWFATGALVLLCGLLIGILFGRQQKRRKSLYH